MQIKSPDKERQHVESLLRQHRLHDAISRLRTLAPAGQWQITSEIDRAEQDYRLMLQYAFNSVGQDPERTRLHADITRRLHSVLLMITRRAWTADSPALYFSTLRYEQTRPADSIPALLEAYRRSMAGTSIFNRATGGAGADSFTPRQREEAERRIFNRVWTTFPLSRQDADAITDLCADPAIPDRLPIQITGALLLGSIEFPDDEALAVLLNVADGGSTARLKLRAATAALMLIGRRPAYIAPTAAVRTRLDSLAGKPEWTEVAKDVWQYFNFSKLTDRIDSKFRDEVLPTMQQFASKIGTDPETFLEQNPEWEQMLSDSGVRQKLDDFQKLLANGADVTHSSIGSAKHDTFFNETANWFMPFDSEHSRLGNGHNEVINTLMEQNPMMCDSDKYSLILSLDSLPYSQKQELTKNYDRMLSTIGAMQPGSVATPGRSDIIKMFVQDLYRFFAHFRRKSEFTDPFAGRIDLTAVCGSAIDPQTILAVAELCFRLKCYDDAAAYFSQVDTPDVAILQKLGFSLQKLGNTDSALEAFRRAEAIAPDNPYTLRRIAALLRAGRQPAQAIDYFRRIQNLCPDDPAPVISEGHCHLELKQYHEALHCYYRAEFMDEKSLKPARPIAWVTLLMRDFDTSRRYFDRIMTESTPDNNDYLNLGHLHLATGNPREAINCYRTFTERSSVEKLREALDTDRPMLDEAGADTSVIPLILDAILYD